jgi:2-polyprenyl-3-methyl-5-hydroxy-6-metoxy-1,4-benzoquinol methylase
MEALTNQHKENSKDWWEARYQKASAGLYSKEPSSFLFEYWDLLPPKAKILEIACGEGRNAVAMALKGAQVTAIDFSPTAIERAKALATASSVSVEWRTADLDFFIPELLTYDAIVAVDFKAPLTLIKNVSRGLKQGGFLMMEQHLLQAMKTKSQLEAFECYKPNELLNTLNPTAAQLLVLHYSELCLGAWGEKATLIAKKTQLF